MTEKLQPKTGRMENAQPEKSRKITLGKLQKKHSSKMKEWEMHDMKNYRKCTPQKKIEISKPEKDRMENAHSANDRKITQWKKIELAHLEQARMENAQHER